MELKQLMAIMLLCLIVFISWLCLAMVGAVLLVTPAHALEQRHAADHSCAPGLHTEDGCQPNTHALMLDVPEFKAAHSAYWHCRRELVVEDIVRVSECVGSNRVLATTLRENYLPTVSESALEDYWSLIPAHPELDELDSRDVAKNVARAKAQLGACELTRSVAGAVIQICEAKRDSLAIRVRNALRRARR